MITVSGQGLYVFGWTPVKGWGLEYFHYYYPERVVKADQWIGL